MSSETTSLLGQANNSNGRKQLTRAQPKAQPQKSIHPPAQKCAEQQTFRNLIGMNPAVLEQEAYHYSLWTRLSRFVHWKPKPAHTGYYREIVDEEARAAFAYGMGAATIHTGLLLQMFIAAAITVLSATNEWHTQVAILGALNTALAGALAYLKGQGFPNRSVHFRNEMRLVRAHAVFVDRQYGEGATPDPPQPLAQAKLIKRMFEIAKKDEENNHPDTYSRSSSAAEEGVGGGGDGSGKGGVDVMDVIEEELDGESGEDDVGEEAAMGHGKAEGTKAGEKKTKPP